MHRRMLFMAKFLLGFWIVITAGFLVLLLSNAPSVPVNAPFASVSINAGENALIYLPNPSFNCTETEQEFQCKIEIQNQLLDLAWDKGNDYLYDLTNCRAQYDGQSVDCQATGQEYAPITAYTFEISGLALSPQELQAVRQEYRGINILMQSEFRLFWIVTGISLIGGIGSAFLTWFYPGPFSKAFASFATGLGMYFPTLLLLISIPSDVVTSYELIHEAWNWVTHIAPIALGIGTTIATALLVWRSLHHSTKILVSLISGMGMFSLYWSFLYIGFSLGLESFFSLGLESFVEASWWLPPTIATILAVVAITWPWLRNNQPIKRFISVANGFGISGISASLFLYLLFELGYID